MLLGKTINEQVHDHEVSLTSVFNKIEELKEKKDVESLEAMISENNHLANLKIAEALARLGKKKIANQLLENGISNALCMRLEIIKVLVALKDIPKLEEMINDRNKWIRLDIAKAFGTLNYKPGLLAMLNDKYLPIRINIVNQLAQKGYYPELLDLFNKTKSIRLKLEIAVLLANEEILNPGEKIIESKKVFKRKILKQLYSELLGYY